MPRKPGKVPSYGLRKASEQAVVRIEGRDHYLGPFGRPDSHEQYERLVAEWRVRRIESADAASRGMAAPLTVNELLLHYLRFAAAYYTKDGQTTNEFAEAAASSQRRRRKKPRLERRR